MKYFDILVVDDEEAMRESLAAWLKKEGFQTMTAASGTDAIEKLKSNLCSIALVDIKMPEMDGIELLTRIKEKYPSILVVMITAYGSVKSAVDAMKLGACDYLLKPFDPEHLILLMEKLMNQKALMDENRYLKKRLSERDAVWLDDLIGESRVMRQVFETIETVAQTGTPVLITGETGTGKELTARAIHSRSQRKFSPFIPINCGAVSSQFLESELFGHERGAFTGAVQARRGRLEMADTGTLFLDEVGDMSTAMQKNLLRVLEEGDFFRLGGSKTIKSDFRLICATHRDLTERIDAGRFRSDFFFRINVIHIHIPPLRAREGDLSLLGFHFLERFSKEMGKEINGFSKAALKLLNRYHWPGNVRELKNVIERAAVLSRNDLIRTSDLRFLIPDSTSLPTGKSLSEIERAYILKTLEDNGWNISKSAALLDINRSTLSRKIKAWDLKLSR